MGLRGSDRVAFDFEGALQVARTMWALADKVESTDRTRQADGETAHRVWRGKYGDEFVDRMDTEATSARRVADGLRTEAKGWATSWKKAMDEQNRRNRAAKVKAVRDSRSGWEKFGDHFLGDDSEDQVADAPIATVPQPPSFTATAHEKRY